jgi:hypothetical protein
MKVDHPPQKSIAIAVAIIGIPARRIAYQLHHIRCKAKLALYQRRRKRRDPRHD